MPAQLWCKEQSNRGAKNASAAPHRIRMLPICLHLESLCPRQIKGQRLCDLKQRTVSVVCMAWRLQAAVQNHGALQASSNTGLLFATGCRHADPVRQWRMVSQQRCTMSQQGLPGQSMPG